MDYLERNVLHRVWAISEGESSHDYVFLTYKYIVLKFFLLFLTNHLKNNYPSRLFLLTAAYYGVTMHLSHFNLMRDTWVASSTRLPQIMYTRISCFMSSDRSE